LEENLKFPTERCLKLLGFVPAKSIPRHYYMSGVDVLIAKDKDLHARKALASLIHALYELERVAICRYISRKNSQPKLVCLIPRKFPL